MLVVTLIKIAIDKVNTIVASSNKTTETIVSINSISKTKKIILAFIEIIISKDNFSSIVSSTKQLLIAIKKDNILSNNISSIYNTPLNKEIKANN